MRFIQSVVLQSLQLLLDNMISAKYERAWDKILLLTLVFVNRAVYHIVDLHTLLSVQFLCQGAVEHRIRLYMSFS